MKTLLALLTILLSTLPAYTQQWAPAGGPDGGDVISLAVRGDALLALLISGALYRHDGERWTRLGELDAQELHAMEGMDGGFIASGRNGIFRSTDLGASWERSAPDGSWFKVTTDGSTLYASVDSTIHRSTDNGISWIPVASPGRYFFTFFVHDSTMLVGRAGDIPGLYRSGDSGESWSRVEGGLPGGTIPTAFHRSGSTLYLAASAGGIFRSTDAGSSWSSLNEGLPLEGGSYPSISSFASIGEKLWIAGRKGTFEYDGSVWHVVDLEWDKDLAVGNGALYLGSISGVRKTLDTGSTWIGINEGLKAHRVDAIAPFGSTIVASMGGSLYRSRDRGVSWTQAMLIGVSRFFNAGNVIYALGQSRFTQGLFRSVDGLDWGKIGGDLPVEGRWINAIATQGDGVLAGYYRTTIGDRGEVVWVSGGVYRSTDRGATWEPASTGMRDSGGSHPPVLDMINIAGTVLAQTLDGLYRSTNGGAMWERATHDFPGGGPPVRFIRIGDKVVLVGESRAFISSDEGATWSEISDGIPSHASIHHGSAVRGAVYLSAYVDDNPTRIYRLRENESRWTDITAQFPEGVGFQTFVEAGDRVLAGTMWNGVWSGSFEPEADVPADGAGPISFASTPNPFRSDAAIGFTTTSRGVVRLTLVSPLGREIATLHDGMLEEGSHEVKLDGSALAAGVYYLRFVGGDGVEVRQIVKIR